MPRHPPERRVILPGFGRSGPVVAVLVAVLVGACQRPPAPPPTPETSPPATASAPERAREPAPGPASEADAAGAASSPPASPDDNEAMIARLPTPPSEPAPPPAPPINDDPRQLLGLDRARLDALLGPPTLIRREAPAEIWQYREGACIIDVFLYAAETAPSPDPAAADYRVSYVEARDGAARPIAVRGCLNTLLRAHLNAGSPGSGIPDPAAPD
ncbi:MAG: hypothetical protein D6826_02045 [Alphaproteobacteria bacterium]|nr:MAG: hypothetical protein D6826_02045 [Alphaproteobacteria bacterium]